MNSKTSSLEMWRRSLGMCMICGQPLGLKGKLSNLENQNTDETENEEAMIENVIERLLLIEECPIRLAYIQFNVLGEQQDCHVIDQYTFLEKKNKEESFHFLMLKNEEMFKNMEKKGIFASFYQQVVQGKNEILNVATVNCKRMGDNFLFAGCRRCNLSMNKPNFHVDTVYRCFELTKNLDVPSLESRNVKAIKLKKLIQQIAFFFHHNQDENKWYAKEPDKIYLDINLWRCISNICSWTTSSKFRFRLIAIFHASVFIYERSAMKSAIKFEEWHIHFFRLEYIKKYEADSFFGMKETEASIIFDLSFKRGDEWKDILLSKFTSFEIVLNEAYNANNMGKIETFREKVSKQVWNEKTLLRFLSGNMSIENGVDRFLHFFKYNIQSVKQRNLLESCLKFERHLCTVYRRHAKEWIHKEPEFES